MNYYHNHTRELKKELREIVPRDILRELHRKVWWKHFVILMCQLIIAAVAGYGATVLDIPWFWLPCSVVLGFVVFNWTVLLHEVVHENIFQRSRAKWNTFFGYLYAIAGGLSQTQFANWHLDHHCELGNSFEDPKRAYLTPKIVKRWYKLLYMTPALFPIYFRAAAKATAGYPAHVQAKIRIERRITIFTQMALMGMLYWGLGGEVLIKVHTIPYFFVFPVVFTLNRLGQHYAIDPKDPAHWTTLIKGSLFWDFSFIYSNYHLEHHYFPKVPCYNLPKLQKLLAPIYSRHKIVPKTYASLLYGWFVQNHIPHGEWLD